MLVEVPQEVFNPRGISATFRRKGREFTIGDARSLESITQEIHSRKEIDAYGLVRFNVPDPDTKLLDHPILTMESDDESLSGDQHRNIAVWIGERLHEKFGCQVQVVFSGNRSFHIHFRINRRNVTVAEAKAIQGVVTDRAQDWVRERFKLPDFAWDARVRGRLELVRLGGGTRIQVGNSRVDRPQPIVASWDADFDDPDTIFPLDAEIKRALSSDAARKSRSRAKRVPVVLDDDLKPYADFLRSTGSTVIPSHWGKRASGEPVIIAYYSPKDPNPGCVLGLHDYFTTDSRGTRYGVGWSYADFKQALEHDFRGDVATVAGSVRKEFWQDLEKLLKKSRRPYIRAYCWNYGVGKTTQTLALADARTLPILMGFYTRALRDQMWKWARKTYPNKRFLRLLSPIEALEQHFPQFRATDFYRHVQQRGERFFSNALDEYLSMVFAKPTTRRRAKAFYQNQRRRFQRQLEAFYAGRYDAALMTQQGLVYRILFSKAFHIPDHINVVFDEIEVGLWSEGEGDPKRNERAHRLLLAGGRWTILTGDLRPALLGMPKPFKVVSCHAKQFIEPIQLRTWMPFGVGDRGRRLHQNRRLALPLLIAEERRRAARDGKGLLMVGNVGQSLYKRLGFRTFESIKGDNWLFRSKTAWRLVIVATCPPPDEIRSNSLVFGKRLVRWLPKNPGQKAARAAKANYHAALKLVAADVMDKVSQVVGRVRGFRNRPDCDVVVYLWDRIDRLNKVGNFPYVWDLSARPSDSIVSDLFNKSKRLSPEAVQNVVDRVRDLRLKKRIIGATARIQGESPLEQNLVTVAANLWRVWHPRRYIRSLEERGRLEKIRTVLERAR